MNNRILLLLSNLNSQFGNTLLTTQQQGRKPALESLESWKAWKARKPGKARK